MNEAPFDTSKELEPEKSITQTKPLDVEKEGNVEVVLFDESQLQDIIGVVRSNNVKIISSSKKSLIIFADETILPIIAAVPSVKTINPYFPPRLTNNVASGIINVDAVRNDHHLNGNDQIVAIADSGLDKGVNDDTIHKDFRGRILKIYALGNPEDPRDLNGHGTHVAGSVLGDGSSSNGKITGMAPAAKLIFQSILDSRGDLGGLPFNLYGLFEQAFNDGARIHTNSWSHSFGNGLYNSRSENADQFSFDHRDFLICFSAGNDAPLRVNPPGSAKNVLTIGACKSMRQLPNGVQFPPPPGMPTEWGEVGPIRNFTTDADNPNEIAKFSCKGPAQNNRHKPDVVAPGTWILSTRSSEQIADTGPDGFSAGPDGKQDGSGDEDGILTHAESVGRGLPGKPIFGAGNKITPDLPTDAGPSAVENYCYLSGTSMATPIVAGSCALVRQYLIEERGHLSPSSALVKAILINGTVDLGMGIPHKLQGWGRVDLINSLFPTDSSKIFFDDSLDNAVASGDIRTYDTNLSTNSSPLVVTLVWRDPPGTTMQNRLHLRVIDKNSGRNWASEDINDIIRNNVQKVVIPAPHSGNDAYKIEVEGVSIFKGVPELAPAIKQDFALVAANTSELNVRL